MNEVLNGVGARVPLGVLPCGGTSVLARAMGLSRDPTVAAAQVGRALAEGREKHLRLGLMNGRRFAFAAGIGFDADVVRRVDARGRRRGRRPGDLYYVLQVGRVVAQGSYRRSRATLIAGGREERVGFVDRRERAPVELRRLAPAAGGAAGRPTPASTCWRRTGCGGATCRAWPATCSSTAVTPARRPADRLHPRRRRRRRGVRRAAAGRGRRRRRRRRHPRRASASTTRVLVCWLRRRPSRRRAELGAANFQLGAPGRATLRPWISPSPSARGSGSQSRAASSRSYRSQSDRWERSPASCPARSASTTTWRSRSARPSRAW